MEENNIDEYTQTGNLIYNFTSMERAKLDKEYFSLFTDLKELVTNKIDPHSAQAMKFMKRLTALHTRTLSKTGDVKVDHEMEYEKHNILDPFTEDERIFIKKAFAHMSKSQG